MLTSLPLVDACSHTCKNVLLMVNASGSESSVPLGGAMPLKISLNGLITESNHNFVCALVIV